MKLLHGQRNEIAVENKKASSPEKPTKELSSPTLPTPQWAAPKFPPPSNPTPSARLPAAVTPAPAAIEPRPKSPDPVSASIPEPPKPDLAKIFAKLPGSVDLPFVLNTGEVKLLDLPCEDRPEMTLQDSHCDIPSKTTFVLEAVTSRPEWSVRFCPNLDASPPQVEEIARLHFVPLEGLIFMWRSSSIDAVVRQQLRNCSLSLEHSGKHKDVALRTPLKVPSLVIDLTKPVDVTTIDLTDLPNDKTIAVNFGDLGKFSRGATWKNSASSIATGKRGFIEFTQFQGARLEFSFLRKSKGALAISMKPIFMEQSQPVEMTLTQLSTMENAIPRTIAANQATLQDLSAQQSSLSSELSTLQSSTPSSLAEVNAKRVAITSLLTKTKRVSSRITQLNLRNNVLAAKLQTIPQMKTFLNEIHQTALDFSIVSATDTSTILIVSGGAK